MTSGNSTDSWATATVEIAIQREIDFVFGFVCNPENDPKWMPKLGPGRKISVGPIAPGTRFHQSVILLGVPTDVEWMVTEFVANRRVAGASIAGPITFSGGYEFEQTKGAVRMSKFGKVRLPKLMALMPQRVANALLADEFQGAVGRLKSLLERRN